MWCTLAAVVSLCFLPFFIEKCNDVEVYCAECLELKSEDRTDCCQC